MSYLSRSRDILGKHDYCNDVVTINDRRNARGLNSLPIWVYDADLFIRNKDINKDEFNKDDLLKLYFVLSPRRRNRLRKLLGIK